MKNSLWLLPVFFLSCAVSPPPQQDMPRSPLLSFLDEIYIDSAKPNGKAAFIPAENITEMERYCEQGMTLPRFSAIEQFRSIAEQAAVLDSALLYAPMSRGDYLQAIVGGEFLFRFLVAAQQQLQNYYSPEQDSQPSQSAKSKDGKYVFHFKQAVSEMLPIVQLQEHYTARRTNWLWDMVSCYGQLDEYAEKKRFWTALARMFAELALNRSETDYPMFQRGADGLFTRPSKLLRRLQSYEAHETDAQIQAMAARVIAAAKDKLAVPLSDEERLLISTVELNRQFMREALWGGDSTSASSDAARDEWFAKASTTADEWEKIDYYTRAIQADASFAPAFNNRGNAWHAVGQMDSAMSDFNRAIANDPEFMLAFKNRAALFFAKGQYENALQDINRAIELDGQCAGCFVDLGRILLKMNRAPQALDALRTAADLEQDPLVYALTGQCLQRLGKPDEALQHFNNALELDPANISILLSRASLYLQQTKYARAIADYSRILKLDQANTTALNNRALCFRAMRRFDEAIRDYKSLLSKKPDDAVAYYNLGCVYWEQKNWSAVIDAWEKCLQLDPQHKAARKWLPLARDEQKKKRWR